MLREKDGESVESASGLPAAQKIIISELGEVIAGFTLKSSGLV